VVEAVRAQADVLIHICGSDFHYPGYGELAARLSALAPGADDWQAFLTNSGTEAVEAAIKLARHHTGRTDLIAFYGSFHGRSCGSLSLTASKAKYRRGFGPLLPGVHHAHFATCSHCPVGATFPGCDIQCVRDRIERDLFGHTVAPDRVAAIVVEPVLGEGGYVVPPREFLVRLRELCDQHGILLVFDEVQAGMGRTGKMFAAEHFGVLPDIITVAKGIASGFPLGAMMGRSSVMTWSPATHGSTCGGNPVAIAAALATIDLLEGGLCENAAAVGAQLKERLERDLTGVAGVVEVRGIGLMIGVEFDSRERAHAVAEACYGRGLIVLECGKKAVRLAPPLVMTAAQADLAAKLFVGVAKST
jgi:4-aminobutyrate aminotransferase